MFFDIFKGKFGFKMSDDMGMDSDGDMMMRVGDNMAMDMDSGELVHRGMMITITVSVLHGTMMITIMVSVHHEMTITTASVHRGAMTTMIGK